MTFLVGAIGLGLGLMGGGMLSIMTSTEAEIALGVIGLGTGLLAGGALGIVVLRVNHPRNRRQRTET